jgi:hypothetical protein
MPTATALNKHVASNLLDALKIEVNIVSTVRAEVEGKVKVGLINGM